MQCPSTSTCGLRDRGHHPLGHRPGGHPQLGVHAGHHHVEPGQQVLALVQRAVVEDVDLDPGQDPERRQLGVQLRRPAPSCASSRSADSPLATVSRGEWSVSAIHSWPRPGPPRPSPGRAAAVGPVRVRVAVAAQRRAQRRLRPRRRPPRPAAGSGRRAAAPAAASRDDLGGGLADPRQRLQRALADPASQLARRAARRHLGGPAEGPHPVGRRPGPLQLERDLPQRGRGARWRRKPADTASAGTGTRIRKSGRERTVSMKVLASGQGGGVRTVSEQTSPEERNPW